jgi:hypothetical protein
MRRARSPLDEPGLLWRALRTGWLVTRLRCPVCGLGRLSDGPFRMRERCEACDVRFERAAGEFTGCCFARRGTLFVNIYGDDRRLGYTLAITGPWMPGVVP